MVFDVLVPAAAAATVTAHDEPGTDRPVAGPGTARRPAPGAVSHLLRSAVALQAESLLRTAGALAGVWGGVLDRTGWIERDARDLALLAQAAVTAGVPLPAGVDAGAGDPAHPSSVVEGLLASHEALTAVLRQLVGPLAASGADDPDLEADGDGWLSVVTSILARREEEILLLRAVGAGGQLPAERLYMRGVPPRG